MARNYSVWYKYNDGGVKSSCMTVSADSEFEAKIKAGEYFDRMRYANWTITCVR